MPGGLERALLPLRRMLRFKRDRCLVAQAVCEPPITDWATMHAHTGAEPGLDRQ